ncbi:MAG: alpha-1,2-fucosyltransferase [Cytophagia bacterium]|jgi:hypothetical protein|nr:alpha-1,2-fucosyltransferase [Cytophagia bacterium]
MAITYNNLGSNGRLGNQMFQYASFRGIASNRGFDWIIPPEDAESTCNYGLFECFKMSNVKPQNKGFGTYQTIDTGRFDFDEDLFNNCPDNVNVNMYLQSERYFKHIDKEIREDFTFNDDIFESCKEIIESVGDCIFLHIRRGDYVATPDHHPTLSSEYYIEALKKFDNDIPVLVFSDTLDWVKEQEFLKPDRFLISENHVKYPNKIKLGDGSIQQSLVPYWDLCLMSLCKGGIIANSSMSWWGAWLQNDAGKVIAPQKWFGKAYDHFNLKDLVPERWEKI